MTRKRAKIDSPLSALSPIAWLDRGVRLYPTRGPLIVGVDLSAPLGEQLLELWQSEAAARGVSP